MWFYKVFAPGILYVIGAVANLLVPNWNNTSFIFLAIAVFTVFFGLWGGLTQEFNTPENWLTEEDRTFVATRTIYVYLIGLFCAIALKKQIITFSIALFLSLLCSVVNLLATRKNICIFSRKKSTRIWMWLSSIEIVVYSLGINYYPFCTALFSNAFLIFSYFLSLPTIKSNIKF